MTLKKRLDLRLVELGLFPTRAQAAAAVMAGWVLVDGRTQTKAGASVTDESDVALVARCPYVSRGGLKLEGALAAFAVDAVGRVCLDVGASTGGFTDCLLQRGAAKVYAADVGHGQLDARLRADGRVVSWEGLHARDLRPELFAERPSLAAIDVSFISLTKVLPFVPPCLARPFDIIALIKPQFEVGPKEAPKGVVRTEAARLRAVASVRASLAGASLREKGLALSSPRGPKGNLEYFVHLVEA